MAKKFLKGIAEVV